MRTVLVIDDSQATRVAVGEALAAGGFEVVEAENGIDALFKLPRYPDLAAIICDVNMPKMGGIELLEKLGARGTGIGPTPVIMLTAEGRPELIEKAKKMGAKAWLVKPFKPSALLQMVTKLAASPATQKEA